MPERKVPIAAEVYKIIKSRIVSLQLMPGQLLMVQQLAKDLGVSRTPVREALVILADEGLVVEAEGNKFRVSEITWKFIDDTYTARMLIELLAAETLARQPGADLSALDEVVARMERCCATEDYSGYFEYDMQFHAALVRLMGNSVIEGWMARMQDQQQRIRYLTTGLSAHMERSLSEHRLILDALHAGDAKTAKKELERHLKRAWNDILQFRKNPANRSFSLIRE